MSISVTVPDNLTAVSNGRLTKTDSDPNAKTKTFHWKVTQPINNYCVNLNIGNYVNFSEKFQGEGGELDLDYWVLKHDRERAAKQFVEAPRVIKAFEYWFRQGIRFMRIAISWFRFPTWAWSIKARSLMGTVLRTDTEGET